MDKINKVPSKIFVNVTITFIGLISAVITIYAFYFQSSKTKIAYEVISNSNVLDINTNVSKLDIVYDSVSLKQKNQNLRFFTLRVVNTGNVNILKNFYDNESPLGFQIKNGYFVEKPTISETSNDYLKNFLTLHKADSSSILFSNIILEQEEYFTIKFLVLHESNIAPEIIPVGKIAGIKEIPVLLSSDIEPELPFIKQTFSGDVFVQLTRALAYFLVVLLLILISALITNYITSLRLKYQKKRIIKTFRKSETGKHSRIGDIIFEIFMDNGGRILRRRLNMMTNEVELNENYNRWKEVLKAKKEKEALLKRYVTIEEVQLPNGFVPSYKDEHTYNTILEMISDGFIIPNNDNLIVNQEIKEILEKFIKHLKAQGFKDRKLISEISSIAIEEERIRRNENILAEAEEVYAEVEEIVAESKVK